MMRKLLQALCVIACIFGGSALAEPVVTVLGEFQERPGNPAVGPDGTVYFSNHPFDSPEFKVMKLVDGKGIPFPNEKISKDLTAVIGIQAEKNGTIWILDMGGKENSPKLLGWDTGTDSLKAIHYLPKEVSVANSFHQDFAIDEKRRHAFIADMSRSGMVDESKPAIVVVDLETGECRRLLEGHSFLQPQDGAIMQAEGKPMTFTDEGGQAHPVRLGLNPIAIDTQNEWVYFSTMNPGTIYRAHADILGDFTKTEEEITGSIEPFAAKPSSDGIAADGKGRVFITNIDKNAISVADKNGTRIWVQDERFIWPDGLYVAPDGSVVATINQLNRAAPFNGGKPGAEKPFLIIQITGE